MTNNIKFALAVSKANLAELGREHNKLNEKRKKLLEEIAILEQQIAEWKKVADSLSVTSPEPIDALPPDVTISGSGDEGLVPTFALTFTNGIRYIFEKRGERHPITIPEIRDELVGLGFDFSKYKQELVPIYNALKRLEDQGEVERVTMRVGSRVSYIWISPLDRAKKEMQEVEKRRALTKDKK